MRKAVRDLLIRNIERVDQRVFEPHAMTDADGFPALIVRELLEPRAEDYQAPTVTTEVYGYTDKTTFKELDVLTDEIKATLDGVVFKEGDKRFYSEHLRTGVDQPDKTWGGISRVVTFEITDLSWLAGTTYEPDPITALRAWTEATWPAGNEIGDVQTDPATWEPSEKDPGIYWRLETAPRAIEYYPTVTWVEARIRGHILTPSKQKRLEWTRRLHEGLLLARRIRMSDGAPLFVAGGAGVGVGADSSAHPIRQGQIQVISTYGIRKPEEEKRPIKRAVLTSFGETTEVT